MYGMFTVYIRSCDAMLYSLDMIHVCRPRNLGRTSDTTFFLNSCVGSRVGFSCMGGPCPRCQRAWEGPLGEICSLCRGLQRLFNLVDNSDELRVALLSRVRTWAGETQDLLEQFEENASRRQCLRGKSTAPQPPEGLVQAARPLPSPQGEASLPRAEAPHPAREEVEVKEEREDRPRHKSEEDKPERKEKAQGSRRTLEKGERKRKERSQSREKARGHRKDTRSESEKRSEDAPDSKRGKEKKERPSPHEGRDYREVARSLAATLPLGRAAAGLASLGGINTSAGLCGSLPTRLSAPLSFSCPCSSSSSSAVCLNVHLCGDDSLLYMPPGCGLASHQFPEACCAPPPYGLLLTQ